jgi:hypothetical protein
MVFDKPTVLGRAGEVVGGYLVFIQDGELMLECYSAGAIDLPPDFRDRDVQVSAA